MAIWGVELEGVEDRAKTFSEGNPPHSSYWNWVYFYLYSDAGGHL